MVSRFARVNGARIQFLKERHAQLNRPADQVWEYMTDLRRAMTLDQFHVSIDCDRTDATNPKTGMIVPILHRTLGWEQVRMARITKYSDYEIGWGESTPKGEVDPFPHSEGWKVEAIDSKSCLVTTWMKGHWRTPVASRIQPYIWDTLVARTSTWTSSTWPGKSAPTCPAPPSP